MAFFVNASHSIAQEPSFTATVNRNAIAINEYFQYTLTIRNTEGRIEKPSFEGFQILQGPTTSQSVQIINGKKSIEYSESWLLKPVKTGNITLPAARCRVGNGWLESNNVTIKVSKEGSSSEQAPQGNADFMVSVELSKRKVYVGEQIQAVYKIYSKYSDLRFESIDYSAIDGFWTETLEEDNIQWENQMQVINGQQYRVAILKKELLYPQRSGQLSIAPTKIDALGKNSFFGRYNKLSASSKPVNVEVTPLPEPKPANFLGTFDQLSCQITEDRNVINQNEAVNLSVVLSGKGNLKMVDELPLPFPADIEVFDPKRNDKISVNASGMSGSRAFEYVLIPRSAGNYSLPALQLSYFNPSSEKYVTIETAPLTITVNRGAGNEANSYTYNSKTDVALLNSDIRYIITDANMIDESRKRFFGTFAYYGTLSLPLLAFIFAFAYQRKKEKRLKDPGAWRMKQADKEAQKRLKVATSLIGQGKTAEFAGELLKAIQGYLTDKFSIPVSEMNQKGIRKHLESKVDNATIDKLLSIASQCEMARFSPIGITDEKEQLKSVETLMVELQKSVK
jgi:hypothetical protein